MIPAGGGLRTLGILELFMENHAFDLFREESNLRKIRGDAQASEQ